MLLEKVLRLRKTEICYLTWNFKANKMLVLISVFLKTPMLQILAKGKKENVKYIVGRTASNKVNRVNRGKCWMHATEIKENDFEIYNVKSISAIKMEQFSTI